MYLTLFNNIIEVAFSQHYGNITCNATVFTYDSITVEGFDDAVLNGIVECVSTL